MSDFEFPCCVEYAKSDRSRCVKCGSQILKQELRIGQQYDRDHSSYRWYHLDCFQYAKNFPKTAKTAEEFLFGIEKISSIDQKRVSRIIEKAIYNRDHGVNQGEEYNDDDNGYSDEEDQPKKKKPLAIKEKKASPKKTAGKKEKKKEPEAVENYGYSSSSVSIVPSSSSNFGLIDTTNCNYDLLTTAGNDAFIGFGSTSNNYGFNDTTATSFFDTTKNNYDLPATTSFSSIEDKENNRRFINNHQVFASSPLKSATSDNVASFLNGYSHRLSRQQIDWLLKPNVHADKVRRAVEAAQALFKLDHDEDDLIDTLERICITLRGH